MKSASNTIFRINLNCIVLKQKPTVRIFMAIENVKKKTFLFLQGLIKMR